MKIVGIITRKSTSKENHNIDYIYSNISNMIYQCGAIPIGIVLNSNYKETINICDGIIFEGGDNFQKYDSEALLYCYENDIPTLGICLGMQLMGCVFNGVLMDVDKHKNICHDVIIDKNSKLFNIFKKEKIRVNSRHKSALKNTNLNISSRSRDGYIESVEVLNKKFFVGVQWHPEDINQFRIFQKLVDSI